MAAYHPQVFRFTSLQEASKKLADFIVASCLTEIDSKGYFTFVLSGGSTPKLLYEMLGSSPYKEKLPWPYIYLFWGDERCVPKDHEHSNYRMVETLLLSKIDMPPENIFRMEGEHAEPTIAAAEYEQKIADFFAAKGKGGDIIPAVACPEFDFVLLGMGKDGHTASLFPNDPVLIEENKWVASVAQSPTEPYLPRITLTLPVINHGKIVTFIAVGDEKQKLLHEFQTNYDLANKKYPAAKINPTGKLIWFWA